MVNLFADLGGSKADVRCTLFVCVCVNVFTESPSLSYYFLRYSVQTHKNINTVIFLIIMKSKIYAITILCMLKMINQ